MDAQEKSSLLRDLRIKAGFGLKAFAREIGIRPSELSAIENGRTGRGHFQGDSRIIPLFCHPEGMPRFSEKRIRQILQKVRKSTTHR